MLNFSKIRTFGALNPLMTCGFESFTEEEGIIFSKRTLRAGTARNKWLK